VGGRGGVYSEFYTRKAREGGEREADGGAYPWVTFVGDKYCTRGGYIVCVCVCVCVFVCVYFGGVKWWQGHIDSNNFIESSLGWYRHARKDARTDCI
jgi:hypothetical protein